jgi:hypothetical protein
MEVSSTVFLPEPVAIYLTLTLNISNNDVSLWTPLHEAYAGKTPQGRYVLKKQNTL